MRSWSPKPGSSKTKFYVDNGAVYLQRGLSVISSATVDTLKSCLTVAEIHELLRHRGVDLIPWLGTLGIHAKGRVKKGKPLLTKELVEARDEAWQAVESNKYRVTLE